MQTVQQQVALANMQELLVKVGNIISYNMMCFDMRSSDNVNPVTRTDTVHTVR